MDTIIPMSTPDTGIEPVGPVKKYVSLVNRILMAPSRFFQDELPALTLSESLAFGIVSAWLASIVAFTFETMNSFLLSRIFERWVQKMFASEEGFSFLSLSGDSFLLTSGLLLLGPFLYLLRIFLGSTMLYTFSLLLVDDTQIAPEPVTFKGAMKIQSAALASQWFSVVPVFGTVIAFFANLVLVITGVRERFRVSTRRATLIVLAPYLFFLLAAMLLSVLIAVAVLQFPLQELLEVEPGQLKF